ncbi:MAG: histidine phosphatase family protein [Burkholderiales bacterium]|nr:histidine phosphatase family protein [Burkholderiales bacterium]
MKLWLVRHAEPLAAAGLCYGSTDLPAHTLATRQVAERLATQLPPGLSLQVSPLLRCRQLAVALQARRPGLIAAIDPRLRELHFGAWEGVRWADIDRAEFDVWLADFAEVPPGGNGEPVRALMARVAAAWDAWRAGGRDAVWITHAGVMRAALLLSRGMRLPARARDWPGDVLPFGEVLTLE